eukprot:scaffold8722_cov48-Phaeocystis_antarctica.AAC.5
MPEAGTRTAYVQCVAAPQGQAALCLCCVQHGGPIMGVRVSKSGRPWGATGLEVAAEGGLEAVVLHHWPAAVVGHLHRSCL